MKYKNNKGFTLIELLATITILGLLSVVTIVSMNNYYDKSKERAEDAFKKKLKASIEEYTALNGSTLTYNLNNSNLQKCYTTKNNSSGNVSVCEPTIINLAQDTSFDDIIKITDSNIPVNPRTNKSCEGNLGIRIYRDSDYVYCFNIYPKNSSDSCIGNETINTCKNKYFKNTGEYDNYLKGNDYVHLQ